MAELNFKLTYEWFVDHLELAAEYVKVNIQRELEAQGYRASGRLIENIDIQSYPANEDIVTEIWMLAYWYYVNKENRWDDRPPPFKEIHKWAKIVKVGSDDKEIKSFAFAVRQSIWKNGLPSKAGYKRSKNGRRTEFTKHAIDKNMRKMNKLVTFNMPVRRIFETALEPYLKKAR